MSTGGVMCRPERGELRQRDASGGMRKTSGITEIKNDTGWGNEVSQE